jgi:hypothetical protein
MEEPVVQIKITPQGWTVIATVEGEKKVKKFRRKRGTFQTVDEAGFEMELPGHPDLAEVLDHLNFEDVADSLATIRA